MTSTADEHPDWQRLRDALEAIRQPHHASLPAQLDGWVDPEAMEELLGNYLRLLQKEEIDGLDPTVGGLDLATMSRISAAYAHGFLLGAHFQAAGGHREVDA